MATYLSIRIEKELDELDIFILGNAEKFLGTSFTLDVLRSHGLIPDIKISSQGEEFPESLPTSKIIKE